MREEYFSTELVHKERGTTLENCAPDSADRKIAINTQAFKMSSAGKGRSVQWRAARLQVFIPTIVYSK